MGRGGGGSGGVGEWLGGWVSEGGEGVSGSAVGRVAFRPRGL